MSDAYKGSGPRAIILMSGGIDSAACAYHMKEQGFNVEGVFIDFGQAAAAQEISAVEAMTHHLGMGLRKIAFDQPERRGAGELLGRNALLVFCALFFDKGAGDLLALGLHAGTPYFDSSEVFINTIGRLVAEHTDGRTNVVAPFITWTKRDVFDYAISAGLPLALTYSCEIGTSPPCGTCLSCRDRKALGC